MISGSDAFRPWFVKRALFSPVLRGRRHAWLPVQVRVVHGGQLHLPLRLKAFAVIQDDKNLITEWLPDELREQNAERRSRMIVDLKGSTVVSYVFQSTTVRSHSLSIQPDVYFQR
jgi:hypothetical protein